MDAGCPFVRNAFRSSAFLRRSVFFSLECPFVSYTISESPDIMYRKIINNPLVFSDVIGPEARSILTGLLNRDPTKRLGVNGAEEIKRHPFFRDHIDFAKLLAKKIQPPFKPKVASAVDVSNFDEVFTSEEPLDSVVEDSKLSQTVQEQFAGFSYDGSHMPVSP